MSVEKTSAAPQPVTADDRAKRIEVAADALATAELSEAADYQVMAEAVVDALSALDRQEWQPIETAPKGDDDFFLVCGADDPRSPFVVRGYILWSARKCDTPSHLHLNWLTHWMPLPAKPRPVIADKRGT